MTVVYIEARPKGRQEGTHITDYVIEDHADSVLATCKTQQEAIEWAKKPHGPRCSCPALERQEEGRSLAEGVEFKSPLRGSIAVADPDEVRPG
jgi:hypothetical protein